VRSTGDDGAIVEEQDLVGVAHRGHPVRDDEKGALTGYPGDGAGQHCLVDGVQVRRWFVEQ